MDGVPMGQQLSQDGVGVGPTPKRWEAVNIGSLPQPGKVLIDTGSYEPWINPHPRQFHG
jgi:hypothetical protein